MITSTISARTGGMVLLASLAVLADPPAGSNWQLMFSDDFSGTTIDATKWGPLGWGQINGEPQGYQTSQVSVDSGKCVFTCEVKDNVFSGQTMHYASGRITTKGKFTQAFGYFEARIKVPRGIGFWPAFWLMDLPEMDIFELINTGNGIQYDYGTNWILNYSGSGGNWFAGHCTQDMTADYHVYGANWTPDSIRFYCDGKPQGKVTNSTNAPKAKYIILNLAIKTPTESYMPARMYTDWVKVWKNNGPVGAAAPGDRSRTRNAAPSYAHGVITIAHTAPYSAELTDAAGRLVLAHAGATPWTTSMSGYETGIYFLSVRSAAGVRTGRIMH